MGNVCDGVATHIQKTLRNTKAYAEGVEYRFGGTALQRPITDNPHVSGTEEADCWDAGWTGADTDTVEGCSSRFGTGAAPA